MLGDSMFVDLNLNMDVEIIDDLVRNDFSDLELFFDESQCLLTFARESSFRLTPDQPAQLSSLLARAARIFSTHVLELEPLLALRDIHLQLVHLHTLHTAFLRSTPHLVVLHQPFPGVAFKDRLLDSPFVVALVGPDPPSKPATAHPASLPTPLDLPPVLMNLPPFSLPFPRDGQSGEPVIVECICDGVVVATAELDRSTRVATVALRFPAGTRKRAVCVEVAARHCVGCRSEAVVVITNEAQFGEGLGRAWSSGFLAVPHALPASPGQAQCQNQTLTPGQTPSQTQNQNQTYSSAFGALHSGDTHQSQCPSNAHYGAGVGSAAYAANALALAFHGAGLRAPTADERVRLVSARGPRIENVCEAIAKTLHRLRFAKHVSGLWNAGLILELSADRRTVGDVLRGTGPGTFCIRFSESSPGSFALSYTLADGNVHHYLVKPEDLLGFKRTLPDFLRQHTAIAYIVACHPQRQVLPKDVALATFYSGEGAAVQKTPVPDKKPYDDHLPTLL